MAACTLLDFYPGPQYQERSAPLKPEFWMQRQPLHRGVCQIVDIKRQIKCSLLQKAKDKAYFPVDLWAFKAEQSVLTLRSVYMGEGKHCSLGILVMTTDKEKELKGNTPKITP